MKLMIMVFYIWKLPLYLQVSVLCNNFTNTIASSHKRRVQVWLSNESAKIDFFKDSFLFCLKGLLQGWSSPSTYLEMLI